jgi:hypothetical protein
MSVAKILKQIAFITLTVVFLSASQAATVTQIKKPEAKQTLLAKGQYYPSKKKAKESC